MDRSEIGDPATDALGADEPAAEALGADEPAVQSPDSGAPAFEDALNDEPSLAPTPEHGDSIEHTQPFSMPDDQKRVPLSLRATEWLRRRRRGTTEEVEFGIASAEPTHIRRGLIPPWLPWAVLAVLSSLLVLILVLIFWPGGASVRVPDLAGLDRATATQRVRVLGLTLRVADTRFSDTVPAGHVISQTPKKGSIVSEGSVVTVDVSAGSETFRMPDVVGQKLDAARRTLRDRGLDVTFVTVPSDGVPGTVVSSLPAANTTVTIGEMVRLSVAAGMGTTGTVVPTDLSGLTFVLDPAFAPTGSTSDVTFDVARRVRALLEASEARVVITRSVSDTADTATTVDRVRRAKESSSTALIGLVVGTSGTMGLQVQSLPATGTPPAVGGASGTLGSALVTALRADFPSTTTTFAAGDQVLKDYGGPAVRLRLGSNSSNADKLNFADPGWADLVARAIFNAIARTYGRN